MHVEMEIDDGVSVCSDSWDESMPEFQDFLHTAWHMPTFLHP